MFFVISETLFMLLRDCLIRFVLGDDNQILYKLISLLIFERLMNSFLFKRITIFCNPELDILLYYASYQLHFYVFV